MSSWLKSIHKLAVINDTAGDDSLDSLLLYEDEAKLPEREQSWKQAQQAESKDTAAPNSAKMNSDQKSAQIGRWSSLNEAQAMTPGIAFHVCIIVSYHEQHKPLAVNSPV